MVKEDPFTHKDLFPKISFGKKLAEEEKICFGDKEE